MDQQETLEVTELSKGVVTGHDGLHPLLTTDTNADVCSWRNRWKGDGFDHGNRSLCVFDQDIASIGLMLTLDHVHVVGSITDGQCHGFLVPLYQTHNVSLLLGCDATADDRFALAGHVHEVDLWRRLVAFLNHGNHYFVRVHVTLLGWNVSLVLLYLSHLLLQVVHGLSVLRDGGRRALS